MMRKWAKQGFLNPADSNDDGWYKFSIRPKKTRWSIGMSIQYILSDCSNKIYLEFEPTYIALDDEDGGAKDVESAKSVLDSIKVRRKKNNDFAAAVAKAAEMINQNLDEFEQDVLNALDIARERE